MAAPVADRQTTAVTSTHASSSHQRQYRDEMRQAGAHREVMPTMETLARRWALLLPALAILTVSLVVSLSACQLAGQSASQGSSSSAPSRIMSGPHAGSAAATPTNAPFTIGAWPSNSMPGPNERIMIYVVCRVQDPTMSRPSTPAAGIQVQVRVLDAINWSYSGTTNSDGMTRVPIAFHDARPGLPIIVDVAATWHHVTYQSQTSFTPAPGGQPQRPSGSGASSHKATPPPGPNAGPPPKPTVTPNAGPTPTPQPTPQPTPLPTPQATNTPTPTSTPAPTSTPPPNPTASPASP